jgi:hypothetical protein
VLAVRLGGADAGPVVTAELAESQLRLAPGDHGTATVRVANLAHGLLHAEIQLLTPYGVWEATPSWATPVAVAGPATAEVPMQVVVPQTATPGRYWALAKVMAGGEIVYTEAIPFSIAQPDAGQDQA